MHQMKRVIDFFERHGVGNQVINVDAIFHVPVYDLGHVSTAACATKCGTAPAAAGYELERTGGNLLARTGYADNVGLPPAFMTAFERLPHDFHVAYTFEAVINPARHLYD